MKGHDLAIAGGGLAGLALSIQMAKVGFKVILFEKEKYPFHRVCGEYISNESWAFLQSLGIEMEKMNVSYIKRVCISDVKGRSIEQELPLGGFGVSRHRLDFILYQIAKREGVDIREQTRVNDIQFVDDAFEIITSDGNFKVRMAAGCHGKRSNLDVKWKRPFIVASKSKLNNWIGVKYHVRCSFPGDMIALHNFKKGYCGISRVEDDQYCLCYLTTAENLRKCDNDVDKMEATILSCNPRLKQIFNNSKKIHEPVIISQISFVSKNPIENHVLMIGDAAGMIAPLCGNGMSMAMHASKVAAGAIAKFLEGSVSREQMEENYVSSWRTLFATRLRMGRILQRLFDIPLLTSLIIRIGEIAPWVIGILIKQTHGRPF